MRTCRSASLQSQDAEPQNKLSLRTQTDFPPQTKRNEVQRSANLPQGFPQLQDVEPQNKFSSRTQIDFPSQTKRNEVQRGANLQRGILVIIPYW